MNKSKWLAIAAILLMTGTIFSLYTLNPAIARRERTRSCLDHPLHGQTVEIGVIAPNYECLDEMSGFHIGHLRTIFSFAEEDINAFCQKLGYDVNFKFVLEHADGNAAIHQEKVQEFHSTGVNLLIGGFWSSHAYTSLSYVNENDMLLFSPSSTANVLAIPGDNLFRLSPNDPVSAPVIAEMLWSRDVEAIIVIQLEDSWAESVYEIFEVEYQDRGGVILESIQYAADETDFSSYLATAEAAAAGAVEEYGSEHLGVLILSFAEGTTIVTQAMDYPTIYSLLWFGSDYTALDQSLINDAPEVADHLKVFSTLPATTRSYLWEALSDRYFAETGVDLTFFVSCCYDIAWIYAKAVLIAANTDTSAVKPILTDISNEHFGITGWCNLNEAGDRYPLDYDVWGCGYVDDNVEWIRYGRYDKYTCEVTWYNDGEIT